MTLRLYNYFRSSSSYRVRIALNLKGLDYEYLPVHLLRAGGEQYADAFVAINAQSRVPVLMDEQKMLAQSLAIIEYLDETRPSPPLLPPSPERRAYVRQIALTIACDMQPLANLGVLNYLTRDLGLTDEARNAWISRWTQRGLAALEAQISASPYRGMFCHGDAPTVADCCLVPQLFNAARFGVDLAPYPTLRAIDAACAALPAIQRAHPEQQPDAAR